MVTGCSRAQSVKHVFIDLDETLYSNPAVVAFMTREIQRFMVTKVGIPVEDATRIRREYHDKYGTTMAGLVAEGHAFDRAAYQREVHAMDYEAMVFPNPTLKQLLMQIQLPMYVFTNGDKTHAERCLEAMDMQHLFQGVISYDSLQELAQAAGFDIEHRVVCKPHPEAFELAVRSVGGYLSTTLFIDDSVRNVSAARELGMQTLLVHPTHEENGLETIASLIDLPKCYPGLFAESVDSSTPTQALLGQS